MLESAEKKDEVQEYEAKSILTQLKMNDMSQKVGTCSGGQRQFVPVLARAAVAAGVSGLFMEAHPTPASAKSDGPNLVPLGRMRELLESLVEIDRLVKARPFLEDTING